tara:strand:+ start:3115 stop:4314 length:1200 start_codon:yes stop_codon:yes gene_type:complete
MKYKKKYDSGGSAGYGIDYSYRDNMLSSSINNELKFNADKNAYYTNLANTTYQNTTSDIQNEYNNTMSSASADVAANKQKTALVTNALGASFNYKAPGSKTSYGQDINNYLGQETNYLGMGVEEGNQLDPAGFVKDKVFDPIKETFTNKATSAASEAIVSQAPNQTLKGASASYNPEFFSNVGGNIVDDATGEVVETLVEEVGGDLTASIAEDVVGDVATDAVTNVATDVATDVTTDVVTDAVTDTVTDVATDTVTDVATDAAGKAAGTVAKAPIKGGGWTIAADIGLDYLSNDNDDSTYTGGEVATDVASLGLDVLTGDFLGAGMQLWDIGSQWVRRNKLQKEKKKARKKMKKDQATAVIDRREDLYSAKKYVGYNQKATGKRSGFGRGELGGFSKYI